MKPRTLLILLCLALGLGALAWLRERKLPSQQERAERAKRVLDLEAKDVVGLEWVMGDNRVRLEREPATPAAAEAAKPADAGVDVADERWKLTAPLTARADRFAVDRLLGALTTLGWQRTLDEVTAADVGLATPRARLTLETKGGNRVLLVGSQLPASDSTIVALDGAKAAYVVASSFLDDLKKPAADWRDKSLFSAERPAIERLELKAEGSPPVTLERRSEELWLTAPVADRADKEATDALLSRLTNLKAERFVEAGKTDAELGLAPPAATVTVMLSGASEPYRLEIGAATEEGSLARYARAGGETVVIDSDFLADAAKPAEAWRSLKVAAHAAWEVASFTVEDAQGKVAFVREGGDWKRDGTAVPYTEVADFLTDLTELKADRFAQAGEEPAAASLLAVELKAKEGASETIVCRALGKDGVAVEVAGRPQPLVLPASRLAEVEAKLETARAAKPVSDATAAASGVSEESGDGEPPLDDSEEDVPPPGS